MKIRMRVETGTPLMTRIDSLAEREARRERAQNKKAQARHEEIRAAGGTVDRAVAERCKEDAAVGRVRERTAARRIAALGSLAEARVDLDRRPGDPPRREVVVHVDADVLADDTAAGRAFFEGGPAITGAQARRMLCEATAVVMLEQGPRTPGRRPAQAPRHQGPAPGAAAPRRRLRPARLPGDPHRTAARPPHAALALRRPHRTGQPRTPLRRRPRPGPRPRPRPQPRGRPVDRPDPRRTAHLGHRRRRLHRRTRRPRHHRGHHPPSSASTPSTTIAGRRPTDAPPIADIAPPPGRLIPRRPAHAPTPRTAPPRRTPGEPALGSPVAAFRASSAGPARDSARLSRVLFPEGEPPLPDTLQQHYDRMNLRYAIGVLMDNRDLVRRLAAEGRVPLTG